MVLQSTNTTQIQQQTLFEMAYAYVIRNGWSVIPLRGLADPAHPKAPALASWKIYQQRKATFAELEDWFMQQRYGALGVVLGQVSGIGVIDIDAPEVEKAFAKALPHLTETFTVRSGNRKLPHYYYVIDETMNAPGRTGAGIEFRSNGQYVVAPALTIGDATWRIEKPFAPRTLTERDLSDVYGFLGLYTRKASKKPVETPLSAKKEASTIQPSLLKNIPKDGTFTSAQLEAWYVSNARQHGRNNALYAGACWARDMGWSRGEIERVLMPVHVVQPPNGEHPPETTAMRMSEARRTITSALHRPPTPRKAGYRKSDKQLSNAVRERLLQMGHDNTARVIDGLLMAGIVPNTTFTAMQAYKAVAGFGIGRNAVYTALGTVLENGQTVFAVSVAPCPLPPHPLLPGANAVDDKEPKPIQCLNGRGTKAGKNRGRRQRVFIMPHPQTLCERLGVTDKGSDELTAEALASPSAYRMALHRALIARAPKQYGREWQAKRLGVDKKTCKRYDKRCGIRATPCYASQAVGWLNCEKLCPKEVEYGVFVTDERGVRHPAKLRMVQKLLAQKHRLVLHRQLPNHYQTDMGMPEGVSQVNRPAPVYPSQSSKPPRVIGDVPRVQKDDLPLIPRSLPHLMAEQLGLVRPMPKAQEVAISDTMVQYALPLPKPRAPKAPVRVAEGTSTQRRLDERESIFAEALYGRLREMSQQHSITKQLARTWVLQYGIEAIQRGLDMLKRKQNIQNPAGYLRVWLRVQANLKGKT